MEEEKKRYHKIDRKKFLYPFQFQNIFELANSRQKYNLLVMINTGARINEIRNVKKTHLDKERKNIYLWKTKVRAERGETQPDPRIIPVSTKFFNYLYKNIDTFKVFSTNQYKHFLQQLAKECEVENWKDLSSHNMRKTFGTWMLALNINGFKLAQHLGHTPEQLLKDYASPDIFNQDDKDRMREILDDLPIRLRGG